MLTSTRPHCMLSFQLLIFSHYTISGFRFHCQALVNLHACRRFLRKKTRVFHRSLCAPITASCVCHTLILRFPTFTFFTLTRVSQAGALSTPWQTQCNEAMPWSGKHGLITRVYLQQFGTVEHAVQCALFVSMVLHATYPSNHFLSATFSVMHFQPLVQCE